MRKLTALIIMDGYGLYSKQSGNAIAREANSPYSPYIKYLTQNYPHTQLDASGEAVGLPAGQMGNSEVGHLNIGAGRVVYQDLARINKAIDDGSFFENDALNKAFDAAAASGAKHKKLHLIGLLSDGGVHSHIDHLFALLKLAKQKNLTEVYIHVICDGRDSLPQSAAGFIRQLEDKISQLGVGKIASVCGRYFMMDRDRRWDRIEKAYNLLVGGEGEQIAPCEIKEYIMRCYENGVYDEFIPPASVREAKAAVQIASGDSVVFYNYRSDRGREICRALCDESFDGFNAKNRPQNLNFVTMTSYDQTFTFPIAFAEKSFENVLGKVLSDNNLTQLRAAETEKYAHVTFFFNGGQEAPFAGEARLLIDSPRVATYDLQPEMSARLVCERVISELKKDKHDVLILNFANCDMVGHTGNFAAAKEAVAVVDDCVRKLAEYILQRGGTAFLTADHGNAERMIGENDEVLTAHTTSKVPFIALGGALCSNRLTKSGALCDIAPTILQQLGIKKPAEMTGRSLFARSTQKKEAGCDKNILNCGI